LEVVITSLFLSRLLFIVRCSCSDQLRAAESERAQRCKHCRISRSAETAAG